jgi:hypothetical protein
LISRKRLLPFMLVLLVSLPVGASEEVTVLFPPDLTLATESSIQVHAFRPGGESTVGMKVNGQDADPLEGEAFLSGEVALKPGMNTLEIGGKTVRVYHLPKAKKGQFRLAQEGEKDPLVFRSYLLHPALEDGCEGCHTAEEGDLGTKDLKEACYECHDDFEKAEEGEKKYVHAPVAEGECTECHDPHYATRPKLQKLEEG